MSKKFIKMSNEISILDSFENFKTSCLVRGLSSETIKWYEDTFKFFSKFYDSKNSISSVDVKIISEYILYCIENKNKKSTINTRLIALKSFLNWNYQNNFISKKININLLKDVSTVKETYSIDELEKLLKKPNLKKCTFTQYRDWVISNFLLSVACRVSTLVNIKIKDLDIINEEILYTHTKTNKQQIIPIPKYMILILKEYLTYRKGRDDDFLFCNKYGQQLTKNALRISLNKYNRQRNVQRTGRHIYRNTFAKFWILNGGDAFRLQKFLGHSTISMTKRYIEMYLDDLKIDFEDYNPINSIVKKNKNKISMKK